jgi:hypothetical protein
MSTVGAMQRGVSLDQAASYSDAGNTGVVFAGPVVGVAALAAAGYSALPAWATGAGATGFGDLVIRWLNRQFVVQLIKGVADDGIPGPTAPVLPQVPRPGVSSPGPAPGPPPSMCMKP